MEGNETIVSEDGDFRMLVRKKLDSEGDAYILFIQEEFNGEEWHEISTCGIGTEAVLNAARLLKEGE